MEGKILGNRYEIIEKIGGGGMAIVYKAHCRLLNRFVALKILRHEFSNDEGFVKRFRVEAQSAASLSHPNVVSIYDVGSEGDIHFIVMEYIEGITLKDHILNTGILNFDEVINYSIQIASALEHAHKKHIIHRDIKPHNIMITKEGIAKVTDFGIARAVSSSTITIVGSTIGSVHYFSPEQARGGYIDEKSDIYSLGVTMFEMVTGFVPFDGESPVAVAIKHIQEVPKEPKEINGNIPEGLNSIIICTMNKEQKGRYENVTSLLQDLYTLKNNPKAMIKHKNNTNDSPTRIMKTIGTEDLVNAKKVDEIPKTTKMVLKNKKRFWIFVTSSVILGMALAITLVIYIYSSLTTSTMEQKFIVGDYINRNFTDVKNELTSQGIQVNDSKHINNNDVAAGFIISQSAEPKKEYSKSGVIEIDFTVSDGPLMISVPIVSNKDYREAKDLIEKARLVPEVVEEFSDSVPFGLVIRTEPVANEMVKDGSKVILVKSKGIELHSVKIPNLIGLTESQAKAILLGLKLLVGTVKPEDMSSTTAKIISQKPLPETEGFEGDKVDLTFEQNMMDRKYIKTNINLQNLDDYSDYIRVKVIAKPSDTNIEEIVMDQDIDKYNFPVEVSRIPIPLSGSTHLQVYLDGDLYIEKIEQP
jgi:serine/threonine protein kinase